MGGRERKKGGDHNYDDLTHLGIELLLIKIKAH